MSTETRFKNAVRALHSRGVYPGPTALNHELGRDKVRSNNLSGRETRWRREVMEELGIPLKYAQAQVS